MQRFRFGILIAMLLVSVVARAEDDRSSRPWKSDRPGWGIRLGLADDPDQLVLGAQYDFGEFERDLHFEPNLEVGFGDDHTILTLTGAVHYYFDVRERIRPYVGGGLVLGLVDRDRRGGGDDTDFEIGLRAGGGVRWPLKRHREFFLEMLLGFGDLQDTQIMAGWRF